MGQLWSKCRAINIVLRKAKNDFFFVGDIDMIFHPDFIQKTIASANFKKIIYFKVGFLSQKELQNEKDFHDYESAFQSNCDATGMSLYPTKALRGLQGFDEFYHGWGAEDTDAHIRMRNAGFQIEFYDTEILVKHQWHPKTYRSNSSKHPFHSNLERINHAYMMQTQTSKITVANQNIPWGMPTDDAAYIELLNPHRVVFLTNEVLKIKSSLAQWSNYQNQVIQFEIVEASSEFVFKNKIKAFLGKKHQSFYSMEDANNLLLEEIIKKYRNSPYSYSFDRLLNKIVVVINFSS